MLGGYPDIFSSRNKLVWLALITVLVRVSCSQHL